MLYDIISWIWLYIENTTFFMCFSKFCVKKTLFCLKTRCFHVLPSFVQKRQNTCKIYISPWKHGILSHFVQKGEKRRKNRVFAKKIRFSQMLCSLLEKLLKASFTWFSIIFQQKWKKTTYNMHFCTLLWKRVLYDRVSWIWV